MARRAKRSRERKVSRRGMGLVPWQPCGLTYDQFRTGYKSRELYGAAYEWLAYRKNEQGQSFRPSEKKIKAQMGRIKRLLFAEYERSCMIEERGAPPRPRLSDCRRVCKPRSKACGKSCIAKKRNCKKLAPAAGVCQLEDFQTNLDIETAAAEGWEEQRAAGAAMPDAGDTSFDFVVDAPAPSPPADDMDFGYEPPTKYGFAGLRGGRGGAAANRGRYRPFPPGQSAIEQHRAIELARQDIIRAIESGKYEFCKRGEKRAAAPEAVDSRSHGQRTASEIEAIRKRYERAGY